MKTIQEMLQELSQCIVTVSGEFRFRTNWNGGKVPQPDLDVFDPNVPFCIENVGDVPVEFGLYDYIYDIRPFKPPIRRNCKISYNLKSWQDYVIARTEKASIIPEVNKIILKNNGDRVYIKADFQQPYYYTDSYTHFIVLNQSKDTKIRARGNIISLNKGSDDVYKTDYLKILYDSYNGCFRQLFKDCTSLTQAPELPATTLSTCCYQAMFYGCTSLTQAPELPAAHLAEHCYSLMFYGCTSLTQAPELPATALTSGCYSSMFSGCTSLTQAPELPATTITYYCYNSMFRGCTSLTQAPVLPATKLYYDSCYDSMFYGCTKLNYVKCLATNTSATDCTKEWLYNVAQTGTFECDNKKYFTINSHNGIPTGWSITEINHEVEKPELDVFDPNVPFCIENVGDAQAIIKYKKNINIKISKDYKTWNDYTIADPITLDPTDRVYIKSDYVKDTRIDPSFIFKGDGIRLRARGNIASLIYGTNDAYVNKYTSTEEYCYYFMFYNSKSLIQAPELPATNLARYCYSSMFRGCASLTQAPELPATTLAYYCYGYMFSGCTSLTQAPELPATTLATACYTNMFFVCTNLNYVKCLATDISAEICTDYWLDNVSSTGDFYTPAATIWETNSTSGIPVGWTRHDINPEVEKPDLDVFDPNVPFCIENVGDVPVEIGMYDVTSNIRNSCEISYNNKDWITYNLAVDPSPSDIKKIKLSNKGDRVYIKSDHYGTTMSPMPYTRIKVLNESDTTKIQARGNIASLNYARNDEYKTKYNSTENSCYSGLFMSCKSLIKAPDLVATSLSKSCYMSMFSGCTNLKYIKCSATNISASNCTFEWVRGVSSTGDFYTPASTTWSSGISGIPAGWTRHDIT